jgi:thiosulfate dehydrogenase [quinone] large subunit
MTLNSASFRWEKSMGILRIAFGLVWAIDAWYKWQPSFLKNTPQYFSRHLSGQLPPTRAWMLLWITIINVNPHAFGYLAALSETAIALSLILGLFSNLTYIAGGIFSLIIWSTTEGFGGPYHPGATDIGTSIMYTFIFASLFLSSASRNYSVDRYLVTKLGPISFLSSIPKKTFVPEQKDSLPNEDKEPVSKNA